MELSAVRSQKFFVSSALQNQTKDLLLHKGFLTVDLVDFISFLPFTERERTGERRRERERDSVCVCACVCCMYRCVCECACECVCVCVGGCVWMVGGGRVTDYVTAWMCHCDVCVRVGQNEINFGFVCPWC